jgi:DNA-directed RNA polymerase specialized sigma24 family protein
MANAAAEPSDGNLLRLMVAGDRDAFAVLYWRYRDVVFRFALQMSGSDIMAQDVTQDVIVLCDLHDHSYAEAAAIIGCAVGTVRSRLNRGRVLLHDKLEGLNRQAWCAPKRSPGYCV